MTAEAVGVIGAGSWGTALALVLARNSYHVLLWGRDAKLIRKMRETRQNARYLPDCILPANIEPVEALGFITEHARYVLLAIPSEAIGDMARTLKSRFRRPARGLIWATKGLEIGSARLLHEVLAAELPGLARALLSGPSFAREVAVGLPTAVTVAAEDEVFALEVAQLFHQAHFRVYTSSDVIGVELGGALKNVLAIAAGIADGLGFGANARAALITRGLYEITNLGMRLGAQRDTLMGLSGLGDLVLTCTDDQSRNRRLGLLLAQGRLPVEAMAQIGQTVEGVATARMAVKLAARWGVELPICAQVFAVLFTGRDPRLAVSELLTRDAKAEVAWHLPST